MYVDNQTEEELQMKKKVIAIVGGATLIGTLAVGFYQTDTSQAQAAVSKEKVHQLITAEYPGKITELELETDDNRTYYEVEIENNGKEYDVKVDANSGEIFYSEIEEAAFHNETNDKKAVKKQTTTNLDSLLDVDEAIEIALAKFSGEVTEVELDEDDGRYVYEIEIETDREEAEIEIDAHTGEIIEFDVDHD